jgi:hypothetical protein
MAACTEASSQSSTESSTENEANNASPARKRTTDCSVLASPDVNANCSSCLVTGNPCQANGCFGGWWCNTSTDKCQFPPSDCPVGSPDSGVDSTDSGVDSTDSGVGSMDSGVDSTDAGDQTDSGSASTDAGMQGGGGALTCVMNAPYNPGGGRCGVERWSVKTGQDSAAPSVDLTPQVTTIATLTSLARPSTIPPDGRVAPTETTVWRLNNVTLQVSKTESDSDYHLVLADGAGNTMIAETPYPDCAAASQFLCLITHGRHAADGFIGQSGLTVSVVGVGFFDLPHGQTGLAPNAIELHPVLGICVGQDCDPTAN